MHARTTVMAPQCCRGTALSGATLRLESCTKGCSEWGKAEPIDAGCFGGADQVHRLTLVGPMVAQLLHDIPELGVVRAAGETDASAKPLHCSSAHLVPKR